MTTADLARACQQLTSGNVAAFCREVGISRRTYYHAIESGRVSELTAYRVRETMERRG